MSVVELYEAEAQISRLQLLAGGGNRTASSFRPPQLEARRRPAVPSPAHQQKGRVHSSASGCTCLVSTREVLWGPSLLGTCLSAFERTLPSLNKATSACVRRQLRPGCAAQALRGSWFWGAGVKVAATTTTSRGIASKFLLLGTTTDQARASCPAFEGPKAGSYRATVAWLVSDPLRHGWPTWVIGSSWGVECQQA